MKDMQQLLLLLYNRAKYKLEECIKDEENEFLIDELNLALQEIVIVEKDIKIVFYQRDFEQYLFEVNLVLLDGQKEIGRYLYFENEKHEAIDDSLVFY